MKNLRGIFKKNVDFVKPLYRKVTPSNRVEYKSDKFVCIDVDSTYKLCGNGIHVKREIVNNEGVDYSLVKIKRENNVQERNNSLPNSVNKSVSNKPFSVSKKVNSKAVLKCLQFQTEKNVNKNLGNGRSSEDCNNMSGILESSIKNANEETDEQNNTSNNIPIIVHKVPDSWLRVYPDVKGPNETTCSVIFRCIVCQVGLTSFLVLWTMLWVLLIHSIEGPYETKVSMDFEDRQNQLIIDLATELRQITPLSPKWRGAIEDRIEEERRLTVAAVAKGARLHPGHFWDVAGTFLFTIYVMTALGFGAPVPQTLLGRTSTLIYAAVSVPTHVYLMVNASTCVVIHAEHFFHRVKISLQDKVPFLLGNTTPENTADPESANCNKNFELMKSSSNIRKHILCFLRVVFAGRGVPLAALGYYACGALAFGVSRSKLPLDSVMFPLEFTTTGGLEHVESHVRILYGVYVEGAMCVVACAVAAARRRGGGARAARAAAHRYRLFVGEPCGACAGGARARGAGPASGKHPV